MYFLYTQLCIRIILIAVKYNNMFYFLDMQKFPLRMKDNDLLVTELYKDPSGDVVTALSVYLTPKTSQYRTLSHTQHKSEYIILSHNQN